MAEKHSSSEPAVVLFDGVCNLCNGAVRFIIRHDPHGYFRFAALQSDIGVQLLKEHLENPPTPSVPESLVLLDNGQLYVRSSAALRIARRLRMPWPLCYALIIVPRPIRDAAYRFIAKRRYRWFGQQDSCMLPTPELRERFLDDV